jgi:hypothetical protein
MTTGRRILRSTPPAAATTVAIVLCAILTPTSAHAIPRQTSTIELLDVQPWPIAPTPVPYASAQLHDLFQRQLNTVCGYIGGDPALPATCSAGSHCAVDVGHGAVGCCPDEGDCTQGVYTDCVDLNSGPQTEANPYVFSCSGSDVCYQNQYEGGFFQYGCGSASDLAATVAAAASGRTAVELPSLSVELTATVTSLSEPTTLGTKTSTSSSQSTSITEATTDSTTTTESTSSRTSTASSTATTSEGTNSPTNAPENPDESNVNTSAIIGGVVGGIAALLLLAAFAFFCWRRRKGNTRQGPGVNTAPSYIKPAQDDGGHVFSPLTPVQEVRETPSPAPQITRHPNHPPAVHSPNPNQLETDDSPTLPQSHFGSGSGTGYDYNSGAILGGSTPSSTVVEDEIPLTSRYAELDDRGYNPGAHAMQEVDADPKSSASTAPPYVFSRGGNGPLWQQNRQPRNPMGKNVPWL